VDNTSKKTKHDISFHSKWPMIYYKYYYVEKKEMTKTLFQNKEASTPLAVGHS